MDYSRELHSMQCPKCKHGMEKVSCQDVTVDRCTYCEGLWFDDDKAQRLKRIAGSEILDTGNPAKGRKYDMPVVIGALAHALGRLWRATVGRVIPDSCRFTPSCSHYAAEALARHGVVVGMAKAVWRVLRCNPFHPGGYDPVVRSQPPCRGGS